MGIHFSLCVCLSLFIISFIICVVHVGVSVKYSCHILPHIQYIWQLPSAFQFLLRNVFNIVVIVSIVQYYLIEAALSGEPGMINLVLQIAVIHCTICLYHSSSCFGMALLKLWMALKKNKSIKLISGEFAACM